MSAHVGRVFIVGDLPSADATHDFGPSDDVVRLVSRKSEIAPVLRAHRCRHHKLVVWCLRTTNCKWRQYFVVVAAFHFDILASNRFSVQSFEIRDFTLRSAPKIEPIDLFIVAHPTMLHFTAQLLYHFARIAKMPLHFCHFEFAIIYKLIRWFRMEMGAVESNEVIFHEYDAKQTGTFVSSLVLPGETCHFDTFKFEIVWSVNSCWNVK